MEELNLKEISGYFISKLKYILIFIVIVVLSGNIITTIIRRPMYHSNTTIVLINGKKDDTTATLTTSDIQLSKNLVDTYSEIIKSRKVLSKVIKNLKLDYKVNELSKRIQVSSIENTEIIKIMVSDKNNELAAKITDEIATVFSKEVQEIYNLKNISIIDKAAIENKPYNINYIKDNIIYLSVGIAISCLVVFILYYFDTSIKSADIVEEKLGLTVIGIVPKED